jgi:hypothetical protein
MDEEVVDRDIKGPSRVKSRVIEVRSGQSKVRRGRDHDQDQETMSLSVRKKQSKPNTWYTLEGHKGYSFPSLNL